MWNKKIMKEEIKTWQKVTEYKEVIIIKVEKKKYEKELIKKYDKKIYELNDKIKKRKIYKNNEWRSRGKGKNKSKGKLNFKVFYIDRFLFL